MLALVAGLIAFSLRFFLGLAGLLLRRLEDRAGVTNRVSGEVRGNVVQIGTVQGDLTICECSGCGEDD
ncbi:hypothetical protein ABZ345_42950 [Lentzea sp. NPDC005914]|uniref:hypothetical protein n=1 Tax=Lentzea sp. NPDC005914 TaxID=3154572 RepID=UPI0033F96127